MSLSITAVSKVRFLHNVEGCENEDHYNLYSMDDFIDRLDGLQQGCYLSDEKPVFFEAGSYSGYGQWRELLSLTVLGVAPEIVWDNPNDFKEKPFVELIHMADNEGGIGPVTSKKLSADFDAFKDEIESRVREAIERHGYADWNSERGIKSWMKKYSDWHEAFVLASDDGFVIFQ